MVHFSLVQSLWSLNYAKIFNRKLPALLLTVVMSRKEDGHRCSKRSSAWAYSHKQNQPKVHSACINSILQHQSCNKLISEL